MKKLLAIILTGLMVMSLVACNGNSDANNAATEEKIESNLIGNWTGVSGTSSYGDMDEPEQLKIVFTDDGKGTLTYFSDSTDFTWVEDGDSVVCTYLNKQFVEDYGLEAFEATVDGDTLVGYLYGFDFTLEKK